MTITITGKRTVITGAASGIGRELALLLASKGAKLALSDINGEGLQETAAMVQDGSDQTVHTHILNVADEMAVAQYAAKLQDEFGPADILINNAGFSRIGPFSHMETSAMKEVMDVLFWGPVYMAKAFLPQLTSTKGHLVNISSLFGLVGFPAQTAYCAAKHALKGFSEALSYEITDQGVGISSVHPGGVKTNIMRNAIVEEIPGKRQNKDKMIKGFDAGAKTTAAEAAAIIVRGIEKQQERILVGKDAHILSILQRLMPTGYKKWVVKGFIS